MGIKQAILINFGIHAYFKLKVNIKIPFRQTHITTTFRQPERWFGLKKSITPLFAFYDSGKQPDTPTNIKGFILPFFILLILVLAAEIFSIVWVSSALGALLTILLMVLSFFLGSLMLRNIGTSAALLALETLRSRQEGISLYQLLWPARYVLAAVLLMSPGFFSTLISAILLLPLKGKPLKNRHNNDEIIDGEFQEIQPDNLDDRTR